MNLFRRLKHTPTRLAYMFGRRKAKPEVQAKTTKQPSRGGLVLPFKRPAPAPQPQQQPAPQRKAAELTADQVKAIRQRERERFEAIITHGMSIGLGRMALAIAGETLMTAPEAIRLMNDLKEFAGEEQGAGRPRNLYTPKPRGTAA